MNTNIEVLRELDELVEAARLLGVTQAKKGFGCHTDEDRRFERAMYESIDKHRAALEAALEDGWQPIETAPKDGTRVLLWIEWSDVPVVGGFRHGRWWADTEHYSVSCGAYCYGGSVSSDKDMKPIAWARIPTIDAAIAAANGGGDG